MWRNYEDHKQRNPKARVFAFSKRGGATTSRLILFFFLVAASTLYPFTWVGQACFDPTVTPEEGHQLLIQGGSALIRNPDGTFKIIVDIPGGNSIPSGGGIQFVDCWVVFAHSGQTIQSIDEFFAFDATTGTQLFSFTKDTAGICVKVFGTAPIQCQSFITRANVRAAGIPFVNFRFSITTKPNVTLEQLRADLASGNTQIGTGELNMDGSLKNVAIRIVKRVSIVAAPVSAPTLSQWGIIIMAMLLLTAGVVFAVRRHSTMEVVANGGVVQFNEWIKQPLFVRSVFSKTLVVVLASVLVAFALVSMLFGPISTTDIGGILVCAPILAYLIHLLILGARSFQANSQ